MKRKSLTRSLSFQSDNLKSKIQNPKWVGLFAIVVALTLCGGRAEAQQPKKIPQIGFLSVNVPAVMSARTEAFRQGLHELGYVEGKTIIIEWRYAEGKLDRLNELAAELVHLNVAVVVSAGPSVTRSMKEATATIPIVMGFDQDPVGSRFVASLARPKGNITGLSALSPEISGKQLELLKEIFPKLSHVTVVGNSTQPGNTEALKELKVAAEALGVRLQYLDVLSPKDIENVFRNASKARADAVLMLDNPFFISYRTQILGLALKSRLPTIYDQSEYVDAGGLMCYSANFNDLFRRAATYVDKILKGAKPADLPVEQPTKFEFIINLKAAKQIGLTVPPTVLARADKVIRDAPR
jgi:putative tryptophan/tyrosine transport system substrate-binding protein